MREGSSAAHGPHHPSRGRGCSGAARPLRHTWRSCANVRPSQRPEPGRHEMAWDFETDPEFQEELDWVADFVQQEIEPLQFVIRHGYDMNDPVRNALIRPLQEQVKARGLWA